MNLQGSGSASLAFSCAPSSGIFSGEYLQVLPETFQFLLAGVGSLANQCDRVYAVSAQALVAATPWSVDLTNFTDPFGVTGQSMARVRYLARRNNDTADGHTITEGGAGVTNQWIGPVDAAGAGITLYPSTTGSGTAANNHGFLVQSAPNTTGMVTSGTSKVLQYLAANAGSLDLLILGCST